MARNEFSAKSKNERQLKRENGSCQFRWNNGCKWDSSCSHPDHQTFHKYPAKNKVMKQAPSLEHEATSICRRRKSWMANFTDAPHPWWSSPIWRIPFHWGSSTKCQRISHPKWQYGEMYQRKGRSLLQYDLEYESDNRTNFKMERQYDIRPRSRRRTSSF